MIKDFRALIRTTTDNNYRHFFLIYGVSGVGKTTFCSKMEKPIFISIENGASHITNIHQYIPDSYDDTISFLQWLKTIDDYSSVIIDSIDRLELLLHKKICEKYHVKSIELAAGGYGKGYIEALTEFNNLLELLKELRSKKHIALICHAEITNFFNPITNTEVHRYSLKLHKKTSAIFKEAVDSILFANFKSKFENEKIISERVIFTEYSIAYDAKNRFSLPIEIPLDFIIYNQAVEDYFKSDTIDVSSLLELAQQILDEKIREKAVEKIKQIKTKKEFEDVKAKIQKIISK